MNGLKKVVAHIYCTTEYYSAIKKESSPAICDNTNGSWGHYTKWNKFDRER